MIISAGINQKLLVLVVGILFAGGFFGDVQAAEVFPGADEQSPSRAEYFSWINNTNEGTTEEQTLINLDFFEWLQDEYGMVLDIYAFDAGAIDGARFYGTMDSEKFQEQFPRGFGPIYKEAKEMGTRLGLWGGPGGFGQTQEQEDSRVELLVSLCQEYEFELFKFDAVCGALPKDKESAFVRAMTKCREHVPSLIVLNHRLGLGPEATAHTTTSLLGGAETYIDVHMANRVTAPHHRAGALRRAPTSGLTRLSEDHGVCISSCPDFWDDDLILQGFNRCLILAPQIYGNPWFLRDDEYPKLARIYNLHRRYRDILVNGMFLPDSYGLHAVARGDEQRRFVTLRNMSWEPIKIEVNLGEEIGLTQGERVELRQFHPTERILGEFSREDTVDVEVLPFRSCLLLATSKACDEYAVLGCDYEVVRDVDDKPVVIKLLGMPGTTAQVKLTGDLAANKMKLDGQKIVLAGESSLQVDFPGRKLTQNYHRKLAEMHRVDLPNDAEALYEATCFAADNNALEVRAIERSGWSKIKPVRKAQKAFFEQPNFVGRGLWDRSMFDGDDDTSFYPTMRKSRDERIQGGALRVDFGEVVYPDRIVVEIPDYYSIQPWVEQEGGHYAEVSADLQKWVRIDFLHALESNIYVPAGQGVRYVRLPGFGGRVSEVKAYRGKKKLSRDNWRGSNLFGPFNRMGFAKAWKSDVQIDEAAAGSYLCVAINGKHGIEGAYAAARVNGNYVGAPDRAVSYPCNIWENFVRKRDRNYTYYIPVTKQMVGKQMEIFVLASQQCSDDVDCEVWITTAKIPFVSRELVLER